MTSPEPQVDVRSVGELLLDADLTARASLWDPDPDGARARVRSWGEVVEAAAELWSSIPDGSNDPSMRRVEQLARGLHRSHMRTGWPGPGPGDGHLEAMSSALARAAELVQARRHPTAPLSDAGQLDADVARARLMHALYVSTHGVTVTLNGYMTDLQRHLGAGHRLEPGDSLQHARDTKHRMGTVERLAGAYLHGRWPAVMAGEHRDPPEPGRLEQALARWDLQAHRVLAGPPATGNLEWIAGVQQDLVVSTAVIGAAGAKQGQLPGYDIERARPALAGLERAWGALSVDLSSLRVRHGRVDPELLLAGREVQAAIREITHHYAGLATPEVMADRTDLAAATGHLHRSLTAAVDLAHVIRDALNDTDLTVGARGAHTIATRTAGAATQAAWVDAASLHHNRDTALPHPVRAALTGRAEQVIASAVAADSASIALQSPRPPTPEVGQHRGRALEDRTPAQDAPSAPGYER